MHPKTCSHFGKFWNDPFHSSFGQWWHWDDFGWRGKCGEFSKNCETVELCSLAAGLRWQDRYGKVGFPQSSFLSHEKKSNQMLQKGPFLCYDRKKKSRSDNTVFKKTGFWKSSASYSSWKKSQWNIIWGTFFWQDRRTSLSCFSHTCKKRGIAGIYPCKFFGFSAKF